MNQLVCTNSVLPLPSRTTCAIEASSSLAESKPQPHQHQHRQKWRVEATISVPEGRWAKGPRRVGAPSPRVWGFRSECWSFVLGGFGPFGFRKFGQNTKTPKLAKVGLAKVGQHIKTLKLAKPTNWPKSVKELAKVGLAKVDHDLFVHHAIADQLDPLARREPRETLNQLLAEDGAATELPMKQHARNQQNSFQPRSCLHRSRTILL